MDNVTGTVNLSTPPTWVVEMLSNRLTATAAVVELPGNLGQVDVDGLPVADRIKDLIRIGNDAERYASRSEADFAVITALVDAGLSDVDIAAVMMNPANGISQKPREQGHNWIATEIARARAKARTPERFAIPERQLWPVSQPEVFHGLLGDFVRILDPHTEADPMALAIQTLAFFGNRIGRNPHFTVEGTRHYTNIYAVLVGSTSKGRKGTSEGHIKRLFNAVDANFVAVLEGKKLWNANGVSGLSTGEGLMWAVRDPIMKKDPIRERGGRVTGYQEIEADAGESDKRLLVIEPEFASALKVAGRDGNTLSPCIRQAWDTGNLRILTKTTPTKATGAHITIVGHITKDELLRYLSATESANGFANRFLWLCVRRSKVLPEGGRIQEVDFATMANRLREAVEFSEAVQEIRRDDEARSLWNEVYEGLSEGKPGLFGAVTSRAEAQVVRLSMLYALLDKSAIIRAVHLRAALALWKYCEESCRYIFGDSIGDTIADEILEALRAHPQGLPKTAISNLFARHMTSGRMGRAMATLLEHGKVRRELRGDTGGRASEVWYAV